MEKIEILFRGQESRYGVGNRVSVGGKQGYVRQVEPRDGTYRYRVEFDDKTKDYFWESELD